VPWCAPRAMVCAPCHGVRPVPWCAPRAMVCAPCHCARPVPVCAPVPVYAPCATVCAPCQCVRLVPWCAPHVTVRAACHGARPVPVCAPGAMVCALCQCVRLVPRCAPRAMVCHDVRSDLRAAPIGFGHSWGSGEPSLGCNREFFYTRVVCNRGDVHASERGGAPTTRADSSRLWQSFGGGQDWRSCRKGPWYAIVFDGISWVRPEVSRSLGDPHPVVDGHVVHRDCNQFRWATSVRVHQRPTVGQGNHRLSSGGSARSENLLRCRVSASRERGGR